MNDVNIGGRNTAEEASSGESSFRSVSYVFAVMRLSSTHNSIIEVHSPDQPLNIFIG